MDDVSEGMTIKTELRAKVMKTRNKAEEHEGQRKDGLAVSSGPLSFPLLPFSWSSTPPSASLPPLSSSLLFFRKQNISLILVVASPPLESHYYPKML